MIVRRVHESMRSLGNTVYDSSDEAQLVKPNESTPKSSLIEIENKLLGAGDKPVESSAEHLYRENEYHRDPFFFHLNEYTHFPYKFQIIV